MKAAKKAAKKPAKNVRKPAKVTRNINVNIQLRTSQQDTQSAGLEPVLEGFKAQPYVDGRRVKYTDTDLVAPKKSLSTNTQQINIQQAESVISLISDEEQSDVEAILEDTILITTDEDDNVQPGENEVEVGVAMSDSDEEDIILTDVRCGYFDQSTATVVNDESGPETPKEVSKEIILSKVLEKAHTTGETVEVNPENIHTAAKDVIRKHPEVIPDKYTPEYFIRMKEICDAAEYDEDLADVEWSEDDEELVGDDEVVNDITETWCSEELETILVKPNYEVIK